MADKMFKVVAQAKLRKHNGQEFNAYWCVAHRWDGSKPTEHLLTAAQVEELKKEEAAGYPVHLISATEVAEEKPVEASKAPWKK